MFGAGGGTSSYREVEETDLLILWGSNARETHPIFFHHVLKAVQRGAALYVVDPRRTTSAQWADTWLGLDVGSDIALANAIGTGDHPRRAGQRGVHRARHTGLRGVPARRWSHWTLERGERITGVPAETIRELAHAYARADRAILCWTLGITEHHNAVDNVLALINLALLTGHVGRYGSGLNPLRGQNNVQGGGDMGAIPNKLPGFQDVQDDHEARDAVRGRVGSKAPAQARLAPDADVRGDGARRAATLYVIGENPAQSEADSKQALELLEGLDFLVVQDISPDADGEMADVVLPGTASWCEAEGTVTNSERRVQRVRKALDPPGEARDDNWIIAELARRLGHDWEHPTPKGPGTSCAH